MKYWKTRPLFLFALVLLVSALQGTMAADNQNQLLIVENGISPYSIVLPDDALPAEATAATQLQEYLQRVTTARLPVLKESQVTASVPQILVGNSGRARALLEPREWQRIGKDGIVIKTVGRQLVLAGDRPRGALYAVFGFLEDEVGCRWWTPTESSIPQRPTLRIKPQNINYTPPFFYREHYNTSVMDGVFATQLRQNGHHQQQREDWGGHYSLLGFVHTYTQFLPPETYFAWHPEWYVDLANNNLPGTKNSKMPVEHTTQLCTTNPEVVEELTKVALEKIAANPKAGFISISQNDNTNYCRCPRCQKMTEDEGSVAGPILYLANEVAARIAPKYPGVFIETLAYHETQTPPKNLRPAANVIVRFAPDDIDSGHSLESPFNARERHNLEGWARISSQLFIWNYVTNFVAPTMPHPNWDGLGPDLRFFAANKVKGVFQQGDRYTNGVGDFVQLRDWVTGKLMWNPQLDQESLMDEFLQGYYGEAAQPLKEYLLLIQQAFLADNRRLPKYTLDFSYLSLDVMNRATELFDRAGQAVAGDETLAQRVRRARLVLDYAWLYRYKILQREQSQTKARFLGPPDPRLAMEEYIATAQRFGIADISIGRGFTVEIPNLRRMFAAEPVELPEFARTLSAHQVIDLQQGDFSLYQGYAQTVDDPLASDGKTANMTGNTIQWAVQIHLGKSLDRPQKWRVYGLIRVDAKPGVDVKSDCIEFGVYNFSRKTYGARRNIRLEEVIGEGYRLVDLGIHTLDGGMYFWMVPVPSSPVNEIYIDRVILVRE